MRDAGMFRRAAATARAALLAGAFLVVVPVFAMEPMACAEQADPLPSSRDELAGRLEKTGLSPDAVARIVGAARPALVLETRPADERSIPIGASKIGGRPDLPADMPWPMRPAYDGAEALARRFLDQAAERYADAGTPPPFMSAADGKALVERRKRILDEARAGTLKIMREAGVEIDPSILNPPPPDPRSLQAFASDQMAMADAVGKPFPLTFVGQFDLAALSREAGFDAGLPSTGRLLLFYDLWLLPASHEPRAQAGVRLVHDDTPAQELSRAEPPEPFRAVPAWAKSLLAAATVAPRSVVTTVPMLDAAWEAVGLPASDDGERYADWLHTLGWPTAPGGGNHQLGGWPRAIQSGMQSMSQLASNGIDAGTSEAWSTPEAKRLIAGAGEWRLVLQIGRDEAINQTLPGALYVLMRDEDLRARRFEKAWVVYEQD